ncbi:MAG TPA: T9SS type A sorting domain-containing protein [Firmicutes bacterium]|nr:T9SS type A sorting domain-containing protein [Bacillota bacterium]
MKKLMALLIMVGVMVAKTPKKMTVSLKPAVKSATSVNANVDTKSWIPLLTEDFEAGIPGDWQVIDGNSDGVMWVAGTTGDLQGNDPPSYGTQYAYYSDDDAGSGSPQTPGEELISPSVDASSYTQVKIKYAWGYNDIGSNDWYKVEYSTDGGSTWNLINEYTADGSGWDSIVVSGSYSDVKVRFVYYETGSTWAWACAADNVSIEGWQALTHDVGVTAVSPSGMSAPGPQEVIVTVANFGSSDESNVPVWVKINGTPFNSPQYVDVNAGSSVDVSFGNYNFTEGSYTITAYTALTGDQYPGNDTMTVEYNATWWLQYDDGVVVNGWAWASGYDNRGWGMRFDLPAAGVQIDSVFVGLTNVSAGAKPLALVVYGDAGGQPNAGDVLWSKDTSLDAAVWSNWTGHVIYSDNFSVGSNTSIYYFWVDATGGDGQYLCIDAGLAMPSEYYWYLHNYPSPTFGQVNHGGDWFLRIHVNSASGLSEWIPYNPHKEILLSVKPSITTGGKVNVVLAVKDEVKVSVKVLDITGKVVATLYEGSIKGEKVISWNTASVKPGAYFIKVSTPYYTKVSSRVIVAK